MNDDKSNWSLHIYVHKACVFSNYEWYNKIVQCDLRNHRSCFPLTGEENYAYFCKVIVNNRRILLGKVLPAAHTEE